MTVQNTKQVPTKTLRDSLNQTSKQLNDMVQGEKPSGVWKERLWPKGHWWKMVKHPKNLKKK